MAVDLPLVSIVTTTYNHQQFISGMIEGVLLQQSTFPIELIIAEDCSTDRTSNIVTEYRNKYPELIKVITSANNIGAAANERRALLKATGKYIAICEGDDYWTDPLKLQKQVDFLDANKEYSVCFHRCRHFDAETNAWGDDECGFLFEKDEIKGVDVTTGLFLQRWITQPLTMVYRREAFDPDIVFKYRYFRDMHLIYHLLEAGKGYLFPFYGGVHILHGGGMHSKIEENSKIQIANLVAKELYQANRTKLLLLNFSNVLQWSFDVSLKNKQLGKALYYCLYKFYLTRNLKSFTKSLLKILSIC